MRILILFLLALVIAPAQAQTAPASVDKLRAVFNGDGVFLRDDTGAWMCVSISPNAQSSLLAQLKPQDRIVAYDGHTLGQASAVAFAKFLRSAEWGVINEMSILREHEQPIVLHPAPLGEGETPRIVTAQDEIDKVIFSEADGVRIGDHIERIGAKDVRTLFERFGQLSAAFSEIRITGALPFAVTRGGQSLTGALPHGVALQSVRLDRMVGDDAKVGEAIAALTLTDGKGKQWRIADQRGHWTLLHFYASWCGPCRREAPELMAMQKELGLTILPIGYSDANEGLASFAAQYGFPQWFPPNVELIDLLGVDGIPFDLLLNPKGEPALVVSGTFAPGVLEKKIRAIMNR